jgi:hypothetical protein
MAMYEEDPFGYSTQGRRRPPGVTGASSGTASTIPMPSPMTAPTSYAVPRDTPDPLDPSGGTGATTPTQTAPTAPTRQPNYNWLDGGYDRGKLGDASHNTAKYLMGRTFAQYDPRQGITGDVLSGLNALGFGKFGGSGQHLSISGITDFGRSAGLDPYDFTGDFIRGWGDGQGANPLWGYDAWSNPVSAPSGSIDSLLSMFQPQPQAGGNGLLGADQLAALLKTLQVNQTPVSAPPITVSLPDQPPAPVAISPDMAPALVSGMDSPGVSQALRVMAMRYPQLLQRPEMDPNSLQAEIMRLIGA